MLQPVKMVPVLITLYRPTGVEQFKFKYIAQYLMNQATRMLCM